MVSTAFREGWSALQNGALLRAAVERDFDVFVTLDRNMEHQQNVKMLPIPIIILVPKSQSEADILAILPKRSSLLDLGELDRVTVISGFSQ